MKSFYCENHGCWGITPACCIGRQFKQAVSARTNVHNDYSGCDAATCSQGAAVLLKHPELVPEKTRQTKKSTRDTRICPTCYETYTPYYEEQIYCDRPCADVARRRDNSSSPSSPSPIRHAGDHALPNSPVVPGELVSAEAVV